MRRGMNGLAAQVTNILHADPHAGHLFVFRGKRGDLVKILHWDGSGLRPCVTHRMLTMEVVIEIIFVRQPSPP
jgi:transposase